MCQQGRADISVCIFFFLGLRGIPSALRAGGGGQHRHDCLSLPSEARASLKGIDFSFFLPVPGFCETFCLQEGGREMTETSVSLKTPQLPPRVDSLTRESRGLNSIPPSPCWSRAEGPEGMLPTALCVCIFV